MNIVGTVRDDSKVPLTEYSVVTFGGDVSWPKERVIRRGRTQRDGSYSLTVDLARYPRGVNLRVAVLGRTGEEIWSSQIQHAVKGDLTIDAVVPISALDTTAYHRLTGKIESRVRLGKLSKLNPTQLAYLASSAEVASADLGALVSAVQLHAAVPGITTETFYGLIDAGLPSTLGSLISLTPNNWRNSLDSAMNGNVIRRLTSETIARIVAALGACKASVATPSTSSALAGSLAIAAVGVSTDAKRKHVTSLVTRHDGINGAFWKALRLTPGITSADVNRLKDVSEVSNLLGQDAQVLDGVSAYLRKRGERVTPAALATIDRSTWRTLVKGGRRAKPVEQPPSGVATRRAMPPLLTADILAAQVAWQFPTQTLAAEISGSQTRGYFGAQKDGLSNFFKRNPSFDIRAGLADVLRVGTPGGRHDPADQTVTSRVKTLVRLYRALPEAHAPAASNTTVDSVGVFERVSALADSKNQYRSSFDIARQPRAAFAKELARGKGEIEYWQRVHDQATAVTDVARFTAVSLLQDSRTTTNVTKDPFSRGKKGKPQPGVADLRTLFGSLDNCQCEQCTAVTSPSSYLADILNFLGIDVVPLGTKSPYDVLVARRPDIPHILLNCDNTNVELPYIDIVNELLEDEVLRDNGVKPIWPPYHNATLVVSPAYLDIAALHEPPQSALAKLAIAASLNASLPGYAFDADLQVSIRRWREDGTGDRWFVFNKGWLVELSYDGRSVPIKGQNSAAMLTNLVRQRAPVRSGSIDVDYVSRQTYGTSAELEANPLFHDAHVDEILEGEQFPPSLPPGLPLFETRLFLEHLKLPREQLIRQLTPANVEGWAIEYLGLSAAEVDQIGVSGGFASWGFSSRIVTKDDVVVDPADSTQLLTGVWYDKLRRVDVLIGRARISYIDLVELLSTESVNPTLKSGVRAAIVSTIESDPATCDLSKLVIELNPDDFQNVLERMRRFLRLQRRIGWKTWELDLALRQLAPTLINPQAPKSPTVATKLIPLAVLKRVKALLKLGYADACALLGAIDRARRIDFRSDGQPILPSQYEGLLLNRAVTNPIDTRFLLDDAGTALRTQILAQDGLATLAAAFQVNASDIVLILNQINVAPTDPLTLDAISETYRRVLFARGLGISVQELIWIERLNGGLPTIDQCLDFLERVTLLRGSALSVTEAWYLLADGDTSTAYLVPGDDEIAQQLDQIRQQLAKIEADHVVPGPPDTDGAQLRRILGELDFGSPLTGDLLDAVTDTKLFSLDVTLSGPVVDALDASAGVSFVLPANAAFLDKPAVAPLVRYRSQDGVLLALRPLTRPDRATLLRATTNSAFRKAVETLYALGKLSYVPPADANQEGTLTCRGLLPSLSVTAVENYVNRNAFANALDAIVEQQSQLLTRKLAYRQLAQYEFPLPSAIPLSIPTELQPYVYLDQVRNVLVVRGQPTDLELAALASSTIPAPILNVLRSGQLPPKVNDVPAFLSAADVTSTFDPSIAPDMPATTADISSELLDAHGLMAYASDTLKGKAIVTDLSGALGLTNDVTEYLLRAVPSATPAPSIAAALAALATPGAATALIGYQSDYRRLSKMALLLQRLKVQRIHLDWLFDYPTADWLALPSLQVGAASAGTDLTQLTELVRLIAIAGRSPYKPQLVDEILLLARAAQPADTDLTVILTLLSDESGLAKNDLSNSPWTNPVDLQTICKNVGIPGPSTFLNAQAFQRLRDAVTDLARLGATANQALQLAAPKIGGPAAAVAKSLAKSKHTTADWLTVVEPISNILREARRSALVDYLVTHPRRDVKTDEPLWHDVDTLYEYLLVDVQMGACMKTTRIRLALNSVQLFVQRCLMNLEAPGVAIGDDLEIRRHWDEWESWRKLYRVWEANRKVFLYPEDWMDPALRDDKTPFFVELENELLQADITNDTAEAAVLNYLYKLGQVSRLEVMGFYIEYTPPMQFPWTLHVVARTYGEPHEWFYRTLTTTTFAWHNGVWSPWQKIDTDIEGDHVLPVVWQSRVYLFWALFSQKGDPPTSAQLNNKNQTQDSRDRWYIRFAWSELKNGKWAAKRLSKDSLRTPAVASSEHQVSADDFSFKTRVSDDGITILCYGPTVDATPTVDPATTAVDDEGTLLYSGNSQINIDLSNPVTNQWRTDIDLAIYDAASKAKLFTITGSSVRNQQYEIWNFFGLDQNNHVPLWWAGKDIRVRTTTKVVQTRPEETHQYQNAIEHVYYVVPVTADPTAGGTNTISSFTGPGAAKLPISTLINRIGRFDLAACGGDLVPTEETLTQTIPALDSSVRLKGMMYVEIEDPPTQIPTQPALWGTLAKTPVGKYRILVPHQYSGPITNGPFFFQTDHDAFLNTNALPGYRFNMFRHPFTCDFIATALRDGVEALLTLKSQVANDDDGQNFQDNYAPDGTQVQLTEVDEDNETVAVTREFVDFSSSGAYSIYNWELFFHIPWLIATRLEANQRFEEARKWFHYIFDPTSRPGADAPLTELKPTQRFWNVLPFWRIEGKDISSIDDLLRGTANMSEAFRQWREDPFKPFVVGRARQSAFMRSVVMGYIDNLIEWGDQQFAQFTAETTNEATLLYTLASQILGRAPEKVPPRVRATLQTYESLLEHSASGNSPTGTWQNFSDVMVEIETFISPSAVIAQPDTSSPLGRMWAFCVPPNDKLLQAWPRVAQRLFNLRHCRDIEGVERSFPIWDPPIDPGLLVRAAAAGVDLASVLGDINAATPHYRFSVMLQRALDLCNEVKSFGAALLAALEGNDAEGLSLLRAQQEIALADKIKEVRQRQLDQSTALREAAEKSQATAQARLDHYQGLQFRNAGETAAQALSGAAIVEEVIAGVSDALGAVAALLPQFGYGTSGVYSSPVLVQSYGGEQISRAASATAGAARASGAVLSMTAAGALTQAGYDRRSEEWNLQITTAQKDLAQIDRQILAAQIQEDIAQKEIENQQLQADNARDVETYLTGKYTNQQLFGWMQGQISSLYFQAYKLAFEMARKAERAFGHELGVFDASYIQFGYWDSLKKGLLAGERLQSDLRRMEAAYLEQNAREYEITKHVSLSALDPAALILLRATGQCEVEIPEWVFNLDYSGHCMRRIKSLALSVPCVAGPYTSVNCTLTQLSSKVRLPDSDSSDYGAATNFHEYFGSLQTIVTSSGREDSGLFEVNLHDERYLPFEGTGAISRWRVELPIESNQFDLWTVADVILHIRYTARFGGDDLRTAARDAIPFTGKRVFSLKHEFPTEWAQLTNIGKPPTSMSTEISLSRDRFPFFFTNKNWTLSVKEVGFYSLPTEDATPTPFPDSLNVYFASVSADNAGNQSSALDHADDTSIGQLPGKIVKTTVDFATVKDVATWTLEVTDPATFAGNVNDLLIMCQYELQD
jgi:hypothetical protein